MRPLAVLLAAAVALALAGSPHAEQPVYKGAGIAMHGDPKYKDGFKNFDYVNPDAPKGGTVKIAARGTFDSLNPFIITGVPAAGVTSIYDTLMESSRDEPFSEYGLLAESIEVPADRSWVAFTLRPEARFHDGSPVTVDDVIFTFNTLLAKGAPFYRAYYASVAKVEKTGERTVKFTFKPGDNRELPLILGQLPVLPKAYWEKRAFDKTTLEPPLGSGPYKIDSVDPGRSIVYRRVDNYWGRNAPTARGTNNFDVIRYDYYRDDTVAREALKAGDLDFRLENQAKAWAADYDIPEVKNGVLVKKKFPEERGAGMQAFVFNTRKEMFKDPRVREALGYAFDFEWTNKNLFYGEYVRTKSYFANSELASRGLPTGEELQILEKFRGKVPDALFTKEFTVPVYDGSGDIRPGLRQAFALLKQAGWEIKNGALIDPGTGRQMEFEFMLVQPEFERIVLPFVQNLQKLGIKARVRLVDPAQYENRVNDFDFDMIIGGWGESLSPGNEQREFWGSATADEKGSRNVIGIKDPVVDQLVDMIISAQSRESLVARTRALDRVLLWHHYVVPNWHINYDRLVYWDKFGMPATIPLTGVDFTSWWIDSQKESALAAKVPKTRR
ncbi:MAG TPA: extracellular solute-binding protein [Alphaproteobacteria bacterium]|jgi:microcin C transport system substrate-binding protein|nr:extracellular solute-binding protein [Alphaproteobacteria bacterium]